MSSRGGSVSCTCAQCGAAFFAWPYRVAQGNARFCSVRCRNIASNDQKIGRFEPLAERFWRYVNKNGPVPTHQPDLSPCWLWTGSGVPRGYGHLALKPTGHIYAHRLSWELHYGKVPGDKFILHHCDTPPCVNPSHLFLDTNAENMQDASTKGRVANGNSRKTHCKRGHEFTPENTRLVRGKHRACRECDRLRYATERLRP